MLDLLEDTSDNSSIWVDNTIVKAHIAREYRNAALNFSSVDKKHHLICRTLGTNLSMLLCCCEVTFLVVRFSLE